MSAALRGHLECCKALLRSGADPNYINAAGDLARARHRRRRGHHHPPPPPATSSLSLAAALTQALFWGIDGGPEIVKLLVDVRPPRPPRDPTHDAALLRPYPRISALLPPSSACLVRLAVRRGA